MSVVKQLLTVVVPAYNVEKYLGDCLDSLLCQTVTNHKIIVVNDGSKDTTGIIAQGYAAEHPDMIQYVEQENQGLGAARNTGLALVNTEYVAFLDSDDWWDCLFMEKLEREIARHEEKPDLIFSLPWIYDAVSNQCRPWYDKPTLEMIFYPNGGNENVGSREVSIKDDRRIYELEANACRRIYRTQFLKDEGFQFPVGVKWEDVQPHFQLIHKAKRCIGLKSTGFIYRINTGGQITAGGGASRMDMIPVYRNTLQMAFDASWPKEEIAYILRMLWSFTAWSIAVTNTDYIDALLHGLHGLYRTIPKRYFKVYFNLCSPHRRREMAMIWIIRSPFYGLLKDYRTRKCGENILAKVRNIRNRLRRK